MSHASAFTQSAPLACLGNGNSNRLVSLWDIVNAFPLKMLLFYMDVLEHFRRSAERIAIQRHGGSFLPPEDVEKAQKYHRVKQIVATVLLIALAVWLAFQPSPLPNNGTYAVMIFVGVSLAVCTTKIISLMNKNTTSVLRAIADWQHNIKLQHGVGIEPAQGLGRPIGQGLGDVARHKVLCVRSDRDGPCGDKRHHGKDQLAYANFHQFSLEKGCRHGESPSARTVESGAVNEGTISLIGQISRSSRPASRRWTGGEGSC